MNESRHSGDRSFADAVYVQRVLSWIRKPRPDGSKLIRSEWRSGRLVNEVVQHPRPNDPASRRAAIADVKKRHAAHAARRRTSR
jgi:hypothetical protein